MVSTAHQGYVLGEIASMGSQAEHARGGGEEPLTAWVQLMGQPVVTSFLWPPPTLSLCPFCIICDCGPVSVSLGIYLVLRKQFHLGLAGDQEVSLVCMEGFSAWKCVSVEMVRRERLQAMSEQNCHSYGSQREWQKKSVLFLILTNHEILDRPLTSLGLNFLICKIRVTLISTTL